MLFVGWLERCAFSNFPKELRGRPIRALLEKYPDRELGGYIGARVLVLKYGWRHITKAIRELTGRFYFNDYGEEFGRVYAWAWRDDVVSPAQYLNHLVRQMAGESSRPGRRRER